jgi:uncharacterized BrkB/YihY/UPF0761 family membrane protein
VPRREDEFEPMPLDPRVERAVLWLRENVPGAEPGLVALERETTAGGTLIAGGLAYRLFLWLLPFSLVVASLATFWEHDDPQGFEHASEDFGLSASAAASMRRSIEESPKGTWYFLILGLFFLMWFSIGVVRALRLAHTVAWGVRRERFRRPIHGALLFTFAAVAVILITGAAQVVREQTDEDLLVTFSIVVVYVAFALLLMLLVPHRDTPWTALLPGAVLVGVGALGLQAFTALYLAPRIGRSSELYGALGAATVILLWLYIIARLITLSAFLNATLWERRQAAG